MDGKSAAACNFPQELQNGRKLMASHGAHRQGAWHLLEDHKESAVAATDSYSAETVKQRFGPDVACICAHLNLLLADSWLASGHLPVTEGTLFEKLQDGILLCGLANAIKSDAVDATLVCRAPKTEAQVRRNLNLAICSLEMLGVSVAHLTAGCLRRADSGLYIGILAQALRRCQFASTDASAVGRWVGSQLGPNLSTSVDGAVAYTRLMFAAFPEAATIPADGIWSVEEVQAAESESSRAQMAVHNATCLGLGGLIAPEHIIVTDSDSSDPAAAQRRRILGLIFLARLHRRYLSRSSPQEPAPATALPDSKAPAASSAETTLTMWLNALGVEPPISRIEVDLRDGSALLQAWEVLSPGSVNWSVVSLPATSTPPAPSELDPEPDVGANAAWLSNCIQVVECAKRHDVSVAMSSVEGLVAGDRLTTVTLGLSMMRLHSLMQLRRAIGAAETSPADVIGWANAQMLAIGTSFQLTGIEDPDLKVTNVLGYLGERVLVRSGRMVAKLPAATGASGIGAASAKVLPSSAVARRLSGSDATTTPRGSRTVGRIGSDAKRVSTTVPSLSSNSRRTSSAGVGGSTTARLLQNTSAAKATKAKVAKVAKGAKVALGGAKAGGNGAKAEAAPAVEEEAWEDEEEAPVAKSPAKGVKAGKDVKGVSGAKDAKGVNGAKDAKGVNGAKDAKGVNGAKDAKGFKGAKGVKGGKVADSPLDGEGLEDAEQAPVTASPAKGAKGVKGVKDGKDSKGVKGAKGAKGGKVAAAPVDEEAGEAQEEAAVSKSPAKGAKGVKGVKDGKDSKDVKGAKGAKGGKLAAAPAGEDAWEDEEGAAAVDSPAKGAKGMKGVKAGKDVKGVKGAKGGKAAAAPVGEDVLDDAEAEPMAESPAKGAKGVKGVKAGKDSKGVKGAKGAKGGKAAVAPVGEDALEDAEAEPMAESPAKGAKGVKGVKAGKDVKGVKGAKGAKGGKAAVAPVGEDALEDEEGAAVPDSPAKGAKGAKGGVKDVKSAGGGKLAKGAKGAAKAVVEVAALEDEEEAPAAKSPVKGGGAKGKVGAKIGAKVAAKAGKGAKAPPSAAVAEEGGDAVAEAEPVAANGAKAGKAAGKLAGKVPAAKGLKNASAVVSSGTAPPKSSSAVGRPARQLFPCLSGRLTGAQLAENSRLTLGMFRQCGLPVFADQLGPETDSAVYLDVLMQLNSVWALSVKR